MNKFSVVMKAHWQDGVTFLFGVWLAISPWVLNFYGITAAMMNSVVVGVIVAVAAGAALLKFKEWEEWVSMLIGAWLMLSPWLLDYVTMPAAGWNHVLVGLVVLVMSGMAIWNYRHHHPGTA